MTRAMLVAVLAIGCGEPPATFRITPVRPVAELLPEGSRHNRGCAVDLTLYDLRTGRPVRMPSGYDEFSERAYPDYAGGTAEQRRLRDALRSAMEAEGFSVYEAEWWHFDYKDWWAYAIQNIRFENLNGP